MRQTKMRGKISGNIMRSKTTETDNGKSKIGKLSPNNKIEHEEQERELNIKEKNKYDEHGEQF